MNRLALLYCEPEPETHGLRVAAFERRKRRNYEMFRNEFSEMTHWLCFERANGQCECAGCDRPNFLGNGHTGRCLAAFRFGIDRTTSDSKYGYQLDHKNGPWDASVANCQLLCIACHKAKTAQRERDSRPYAGLAAALAAKPAQPYLDAITAILKAQGPQASSPFGPPPKTPPPENPLQPRPPRK